MWMGAPSKVSSVRTAFNVVVLLGESRQLFAPLMKKLHTQSHSTSPLNQRADYPRFVCIWFEYVAVESLGTFFEVVEVGYESIELPKKMREILFRRDDSRKRWELSSRHANLKSMIVAHSKNWSDNTSLSFACTAMKPLILQNARESWCISLSKSYFVLHEREEREKGILAQCKMSE